MAIAVTYVPVSMSAGQYDEVIKQLDAAGKGTPAGRSYHVAFASGDSIRVMDIWESHEDFAAFGQALLPVLQGLGVELGQLATGDVHNIIEA